MSRPWLAALMASAVCAMSLGALAAPKKKTDRSEQSSSRSHRKKPKGDKGDLRAKADGGAPASEGKESKLGDAGAADTNVKQAKQTDAGASYSFGELEIEGRLKTPQIVYFLRRVRAEFAAQDLGHRSFYGELKETRKEPSF